MLARTLPALPALAALVLALTTLPGLAGHPLVSYASSASMVPTIGVGDGFLVDPFATPAVGDLVVYERHDGQLAVHRVVGVAPGGLLTRGDANPVTDQEAGEPPVPADRVRGRVLTHPDGAAVVLPGLGLPLLEANAQLRQLERSGIPAVLLLVIAGVAGAALLLHPRATGARPRATGVRRPASRSLRARFLPRGVLARHAALGCLAVLALGIVAASGAHEEVPVTLVVVDSAPTGQQRSTEPGGELPRTLELRALPFLPTHAVVEAPGDRVRVPDQGLVFLGPGAVSHLTVQQRAGSERGLQEDTVRVWQYPAFLPEEATLALHRAHSGAPTLLLGGLLFLAVGAWFASLRLGDLPLAHLRGSPRGAR